MIKIYHRKRICKNLLIGLLIGFFISSVSPWWSLMPPIAIIMFFVVFICNPIKSNILQINTHKWAILIFSALFWAGLIGMTYTDNKIEGWLDVILKSSLLLFPLTFAVMPQDLLNKKELEKIVIAFVLIVFGSSVYCFLNAFIIYVFSADISVFYYTKLCFFQHPSYYGLSINLALLIILIKWIQAKKSYSKITRVSFYLMITWFIIFLILLQSKASMISFLFTILFLCAYLIIQRKPKVAYRFLIFNLLTVAMSCVLIPNSLVRFHSARIALKTETHQTTKKESTTARLTFWKTAIETIQEGPIWGTGTGDVERVFNEKLLSYGYVKAGEPKYNSHSQILQTIMKLGIFGAIAMVISLLYPLWIGIKQQNLIYLGLIIIIMFNLMVESMFERQAGLMFFAFFNSFVFFVLMRQKEEFPSL